MESSTRDNHDRGKVGDFLKEHVAPNSELLSLHSLLVCLPQRLLNGNREI